MTAPLRIAVVGANGQLGAAVLVEARQRGHHVLPLTRRDFDVTDAASATRVLSGLRATAIVNCTADDAIDAAEADPGRAFAVNAAAVSTMALVARASGATLVHYSTDFVFDGTTRRPYRETDRAHPLSVYGCSKLAGEIAAAITPKHYVLRVGSLFGRGQGGPVAKGTIASIVRGLAARETVRVFEDRTVSPTSVLDAARTTVALLESQAAPGIYHCVSSGHCTWLALAKYLADLIDVPATLVTIRSSDERLPAPRPLYCAMSNEKLNAAGMVLPDWRAALAYALSEIGLAA
jgi:dTDP-4-dehydrorhamnose reductase